MFVPDIMYSLSFFLFWQAQELVKEDFKGSKVDWFLSTFIMFYVSLCFYILKGLSLLVICHSMNLVADIFTFQWLVLRYAVLNLEEWRLFKFWDIFIGGEVTSENWQWMYKQMQINGLPMPALVFVLSYILLIFTFVLILIILTFIIHFLLLV